MFPAPHHVIPRDLSAALHSGRSNSTSDFRDAGLIMPSTFSAHNNNMQNSADASSSSFSASSFYGPHNAPNNGMTTVSCSTKVEPIRLSQNWTIENFAPLLKLCKPGHCLRSHVFRHAAVPEATWQLCMYPAGKRAENVGFVSLFLKMSSASPNREILVTAEYKFFFLDEHKQPKFTNVNVGDFHAKPPKCGHSWGLRNIPRNRVIASLSSDGSLLVHCEIEFLPDPCKLRSQVVKSSGAFGDERDYFLQVPVQLARSFVDNSVAAFEDGLLSDLTVVVPSGRDDCDVMPTHVSSAHRRAPSPPTAATGQSSSGERRRSRSPPGAVEDDDEDDTCCWAPPANTDDEATPTENVEYRAHKFILASHSPVFRAMFEHDDLVESRQNTLVIADFKPRVVAAMLRYLYSCGTQVRRPSCKSSSPNSNLAFDVKDETLVVDLLAMADKYSIQHLKVQCEDWLSYRLSRDNVCRTLALADLHQAPYLKRACLSFLASHRREVFSLEDWSQLKRSHPQLASDVLELLLNQQLGSESGESSGGASGSCFAQPNHKRPKTEQSMSGAAGGPGQGPKRLAPSSSGGRSNY